MRRLTSSLLIVVILLTTIVVPVSAETYPIKAGVNLTRTFTAPVDGNMVETNKAVINYLDQTKNYFNINYQFTFDPIPKTSVSVPQVKKEVVLVLDKSGSMAWDLAGNTISGSGTSRMDILKQAATLFVDKLAENQSMKMSLITYSSSTDVYSYGGNKMIDISNGNVAGTTQNNRNAIKSKINSLYANGGTNVGDAFRKGYQLIGTSESADDAEKYYVFLSDGEPSFYSYEKKTSFNVDDNNNGWIFKTKWENYQNYYYYYYRGTSTNPSTNSGNDYTRGKKYAELMAPSLDVFDKSYFLSFNDDQYTALSDIADKISGDKGQYQQAKTADEINKVYDEISNEILAVMSLDNVTYTDVLPRGLVLDIPDDHPYKNKISIDGQNVTIDIHSVNYKLVGNEYVADPINITLKAKYTDPGTYSFDSADNAFVYKDINGDAETKHVATNSFEVTRDPVQNVKATREQLDGQHPKNEVTVTWDAYDGALTYNIYKVYNGVDKLIGTTSSDVLSFKTPIEGQDGAKTTYKVEAVLNQSKLSDRGSAEADTVPSILNLKVERENNIFTVSWDKIENTINKTITGGDQELADIKYHITPRIRPLGDGQTDTTIKEGDASNPTFLTINNRVMYQYTLENPGDYTDYSSTLEFFVGADKTDLLTNDVIAATPALSLPQRIKQVVTTSIVTSVNDFIYAKNKEIQIDVASDVEAFPDGVFLYDPVIVVEMLLPEESSVTPIDYSYPTVSILKEKDSVYEPIPVTTKTEKDGNTTLYIQLNDYKSTIMTENTKLKLNLEFSVAYKSNDGKLDGTIYQKIREVQAIEAYQIPSKFPTLLDAYYTTDIDELMKLRIYYMYNTSAKVIQDQKVRDVKVGITSSFIEFTVPTVINDEF